MGDDADALLAELARVTAARIAPEIEADAIKRATERVRERVTESYAAALEQSLLAELAGSQLAEPSPTPTAGPQPVPEDDRTGWYLYAFAADSDPATLADVPGLDPHGGVEVLGDAELAAIGSPVRLELLRAGQESADLSPDGWLATAVRRHEEVVEQAGRTVVPMRFGTVYPNREAVARLLEGRRPVLTEELDRLRDCAEWGVKITAVAARDEDAPTPEEPRPTGSAYLRRKSEHRRAVTEAREALRETIGRVHETLDATSEAAVITPVQRSEQGQVGQVVLNASYLVSAGRRVEFDAAVESLAAEVTEAGLEVRCTGPWPPYHFVTLRLDDQEHSDG